MATPEKLRCFRRPSRDKNHSLGEIFKVCRQGHALQEGKIIKLTILYAYYEKQPYNSRLKQIENIAVRLVLIVSHLMIV